MQFLIMCIVLVVVGFMLLRQLDQYRWRRYRVERERYFQMHPFHLDGDGQFGISLPLSKPIQIKLMNAFMWKATEQQFLKKVRIQREEQSETENMRVKVALGDIHLGYLESRYARQLCQNLDQTDFGVGRPIEVLAEIWVLVQQAEFIGCKIKLDLPEETQHLAELLHS